MKFYKLILNYNAPLGEVERRRTTKNFNFLKKHGFIDLIRDQREFMPDEMLEGEFSLTDESQFLNILKVSHLEWSGLLLDDESFDVLKKFKLQDFKLKGIDIFQNNKNNKSIHYNLIHFYSNGAARIGMITYKRTLKRSQEQQIFRVSYNEFLNNEIDVSISERMLRKISIMQIEVMGNNDTHLFFDFFLFKNDFIISENILEDINRFTGFKVEEGPDIVFVSN